MRIAIDGGQLELAQQPGVVAPDQVLGACRPDWRRYATRDCARSAVDDAVCEALIILYRRLPGLRSLGAGTTWLFQIARRESQRLSFVMLHQPVLPAEAEARHYLQTRSPHGPQIGLAMAIQPLPNLL